MLLTLWFCLPYCWLNNCFSGSCAPCMHDRGARHRRKKGQGITHQFEWKQDHHYIPLPFPPALLVEGGIRPPLYSGDRSEGRLISRGHPIPSSISGGMSRCRASLISRCHASLNEALYWRQGLPSLDLHGQGFLSFFQWNELDFDKDFPWHFPNSNYTLLKVGYTYHCIF